MGVEHAVGAYETQGINMSMYIDAPLNTEITVASLGLQLKDMMGNEVSSRLGSIMNSLIMASAENAMTYGERLYSRILLTAEFGGYQSRIAPYDFIVVSGEIAACLKKQSKFIINPVSTTLSNSPELSYSGTIFDTISVYNNPKIPFNDPRVLFGRRGDDTDPGSKFLAYDLAATRQTIAEDTMSEKIRIWSRFQIADIGFYPELNYYLALFVNTTGWA